MKRSNTIILNCSLLLAAMLFNVPQTLANEGRFGLQHSVGLGDLRGQPLEFLENVGQLRNTNGEAATNVLFKAEAPGLDVYITTTGITYVFLEEEEKIKGVRKWLRFGREGHEAENLKYEKIELILPGAGISRENIIKGPAGIASYHFLLGKEEIFYDVKKYARITVRNIYPGIDWVLYSDDSKGFKYDFVVHEGADLSKLVMEYVSAGKTAIDDRGQLLVKGHSGRISEMAPYSYIKETGEEIPTAFVAGPATKKGGLYTSKIYFDLGEKPPGTLVIDPQLLWSTFYGGSSFEGTLCNSTDRAGNLYLCGYLASNDFPILSQGTYLQNYASGHGFLVKFSNDGTLLWSTFFGPANISYLATDNSGNVFLCGSSSAPSFPTKDTGTYFQSLSAGSMDAYVSRFDSTGKLTWSTFYGGTSYDLGTCIATDESGNIFLTGTTSSADFPVQNGGGYFVGTFPGSGTGFIVKFDNTGNRLWATYVQGATHPICTTDLQGNLFLTGQTSATIPFFDPGSSAYYQSVSGGLTDIYLLKFSGSSNLLWGTLYGGAGSDRGMSLACDKGGNLFVTGTTTSTNLPVHNAGTYFQGSLTGPSSDIFVLKFDQNMVRQWATYLGGSRIDMQLEYDNLAIDTCGNLFVGFTTQSRNLPFQQACDGGMFDNTIDTTISQNNNKPSQIF